MYFCPKCDTVFDIEKGSEDLKGGSNKKIISESSENISTSSTQSKGGADIDEIIKKILAKEELDDNILKEISLNDLIKNSEYKKLKTQNKEFVYNKFLDLLPLDKKNLPFDQKITDMAYFICKNCGYSEKMKPGTLIFSKVSSDISQSYKTEDIKTMKYSDILPKTRKYKCPNSKCESHTDLNKREASFFRMNNTHRVKYICHACDTSF